MLFCNFCEIIWVHLRLLLVWKQFVKRTLRPSVNLRSGLLHGRCAVRWPHAGITAALKRGGYGAARCPTWCCGHKNRTLYTLRTSIFRYSMILRINGTLLIDTRDLDASSAQRSSATMALRPSSTCSRATFVWFYPIRIVPWPVISSYNSVLHEPQTTRIALLFQVAPFDLVFPIVAFRRITEEL